MCTIRIFRSGTQNLWFLFPAGILPHGASGGAKPQPAYSYPQPGQLFSAQPKVETASSIAAATTSQSWKIMETLNLGPKPKPNPVASFTMSQGAAPSSSSSSNATSATNQDYSTVNLSDLHEFFPNISSAMTQEPLAAPQGNTAPSQTSSSTFTLQGSQFRVDPPIDEDIPEFPSFSEAQVPVTLDSLNMDDFEDLLNPRLMNEGGNGASMLAQASCPPAAPSSTSVAAQNSAPPQNSSDPSSNPGSTWMNYPNSIVNLLQAEGMIDMAANNNHRPAMLDEFDELMSADEDRLISIFNSGSQAGFVSGHQT